MVLRKKGDIAYFSFYSGNSLSVLVGSSLPLDYFPHFYSLDRTQVAAVFWIFSQFWWCRVNSGRHTWVQLGLLLSGGRLHCGAVSSCSGVPLQTCSAGHVLWAGAFLGRGAPLPYMPRVSSEGFSPLLSSVRGGRLLLRTLGISCCQSCPAWKLFIAICCPSVYQLSHNILFQFLCFLMGNISATFFCGIADALPGGSHSQGFLLPTSFLLSLSLLLCAKSFGLFGSSWLDGVLM